MARSLEQEQAGAAASANRALYASDEARGPASCSSYRDHSGIRALHDRLLASVFASARRTSEAPRVLDLGSGEGEAARRMLALGARVTAVDVSAEQLAALRAHVGENGAPLELRVGDVADVVDEYASTGVTFDVVMANSFLHHVPDYLGLVRAAAALLPSRGQFLSFQDPLRFDSLPRPTRLLADCFYVTWRLRQRDVLGGIARRLRRRRGLYLPDSVEDNAEYHTVRGGVDQDALLALLAELGFAASLVRYFATPSVVWQPVGEALHLENTFAILAARR